MPSFLKIPVTIPALACIAWCLNFATPTISAERPAVRQQDADFVNQLLERRLHRLAEHHCHSMTDRTAVAEERVAWRLRLANCRRHHSWFLDAINRKETLSHTLKELEDLISQPDLNETDILRIRLEQTRTILTSVRLAVMVAEAGHLAASAEPKFTPASVALPEELAAYQPTVTRAIELARQAMRETKRRRTQIGSIISRRLQDECRLTLAELLLIRARLTTETTTDDRQQASELISSTLRSSRDSDLIHIARRLNLQRLLDERNWQQFAARVRLAAATTTTDFILIEARAYLAQGKTEQAIRLLTSDVQMNVLQQQQCRWLLLECLLVRQQFAMQLQDDKLLKATSDSFDATVHQIRPEVTGAFRDAVDRATERFHLVEASGLEAADLMERIAYLRARQQYTEALRLTEVAMRRLPPETAERSYASLLLKSGELLLDCRDWAEAEKRLGEAATRFGQQKRHSDQAAADLLRIFAMAQQIAQRAPGASESDYAEALAQHTRRFPNERSAATARSWLVDFFSRSAPLKAARILLTPAPARPGSEQLANTENAGRLLTEHTDHPDYNEVRQLFLEAATEISPDQPGTEATLIQWYRLLLNHRPGDSTNWSDQVEQIELLRNRLTSLESSPRVSRAVFRSFLLLAVAKARINCPQDEWKNICRKLNELTNIERIDAAHFFSQHCSTGQLQGGDLRLAQQADMQLLQTQFDKETPVDQLTDLLRIATPVARRTSDPVVLTRLLKSLSTKPLTDDQVRTIREILSVTDRSDGAGSTAVPIAIRTFWQSVRLSQDQGSDIWLEASLQISKYLALEGAINPAAKQLALVAAIYPDWGTAERRRRAQDLIDRLEQASSD